MGTNEQFIWINNNRDICDDRQLAINEEETDAVEACHPGNDFASTNAEYCDTTTCMDHSDHRNITPILEIEDSCSKSDDQGVNDINDDVIMYPAGGAFNKLRKKQIFLEQLLNEHWLGYSRTSTQLKKDFVNDHILQPIYQSGRTLKIFHGVNPENGFCTIPQPDAAFERLAQRLRDTKKIYSSITSDTNNTRSSRSRTKSATASSGSASMKAAAGERQSNNVPSTNQTKHQKGKKAVLRKKPSTKVTGQIRRVVKKRSAHEEELRCKRIKTCKETVRPPMTTLGESSSSSYSSYTSNDDTTATTLPTTNPIRNYKRTGDDEINNYIRRTTKKRPTDTFRASPLNMKKYTTEKDVKRIRIPRRRNSICSMMENDDCSFCYLDAGTDGIDNDLEDDLNVSNRSASSTRKRGDDQEQLSFHELKEVIWSQWEQIDCWRRLCTRYRETNDVQRQVLLHQNTLLSSLGVSAGDSSGSGSGSDRSNNTNKNSNSAHPTSIER